MDNLCEGRNKAYSDNKDELYNYKADSSYENEFANNVDYKYVDYDDKSFIDEIALKNKSVTEDSPKNICTYNEVEDNNLGKESTHKVLNNKKDYKLNGLDKHKNESERVIDENNSSIKDDYKLNSLEEKYSDKSWGITLILCILFGFIGIHRFYVGKAGTAIIMLLTLGGFGIWVLVDLIRIIINNFSDEEGKLIKRTILFS